MSQGRKWTEKRNRFKIFKSYSSSLESSRSKDDSTSESKSVPYSFGDQKIRHKNFHNSKKFHSRKSLKSPLVVSKNTNSNDSGFRRNSDYSNKHKTRHHHHHHEDNFLSAKSSRTEKPKCHKIVHSKRNKRGSESFGEEQSRNLENERHRRFSFIEINGFVGRNSLCNSFHSEKNKKDYSKMSSKCNHINNGKNRKKDEEKETNVLPEFVNVDHNEDKSVSNFSQDEKREKIEESIEGSARTRGFCFKKQEGRKSYKKVNDNLNVDYHDFRKSTKITRSQPDKRSKSVSSTECKNQSRKGKSIENSSKKSFDSKVDKTKQTKKIDIKETKIADEEEEILKSNSNPTTQSLFESTKSQGPRRKSSIGGEKILKTKEGKNNSNINLNSENDTSEEGKVQKFINDSQMKIEDKKLREFQETKKSKKKYQKRKGTRYKNSRPEFKRKTLRYLIYLIRKSILSDREENENQDKEKKKKISRENSCIRIKQENKGESGCESSGYDSLKNIQDRLNEINQNENSETNFSHYLESAYLKNFPNGIEFLETEKYCLYKIYRSTDGGILLKESQSQELKNGEYVIGKRILKEPETILNFSKSTTSEINVNQLFLLRNNSTQTEIDFTSRLSSRKKSWFRKSYSKKCRSRSKKYFASLESTSNSSFPEASDFEQFNLPLRKTISSKRSLSNLPKPYAHFLKKSVAVDTSDLINFTSVKNPEDKMVTLFNNSENEKNLRYLDPKRENSGTPLCEKPKLLFNVESIKSGENFSSSAHPTIPVSWLKLDNSEFIAQKLNMEEMIRVQMENNCNSIQSTEFQIKKPDLIYSEGNSQDKRRRKEKKSSRKFFRIFKKKKNYNRIRFEDEKVKKW